MAARRTATVKVVPEVDLKVLDPVWTTALITGTHALLVYDTLFAADRQQRVHPQMVEKFARDEDGADLALSNCATASAGTTAPR